MFSRLYNSVRSDSQQAVEWNKKGLVYFAEGQHDEALRCFTQAVALAPMEASSVSSRKRHFKKNSIGKIKNINNEIATIWFIGTNEIWDVPISDIMEIDVLKTGDKFEIKICNICHRLLSIDKFSRNQNNKHGVVRRPSCNHCRTDIDKRAPKSSQAKLMEKERPPKGSPFQCPICRKRSIVGVTAKIVADHNHHTGDIRDFICDSCNTGLGRFKNGEDHLRDAIVYLEERER